MYTYQLAIIVIVSLAFSYYFAPVAYAEFGEKWNAYSWLQVFGFCTLLSGQMVYSGLVTLPIPSLYPEDEEDLRSFVASPMPSMASRYMATPLPPYSPPYEEVYKAREKSWTNLNKENPFGVAAG
eukprot:g19152.t1